MDRHRHCIGEVRHQHGSSLDDGSEHEIEDWVVAEDLVLELAELGPRIDPELLAEELPRRGERPQGVGLPARPVQREHQLRPEPLVEGVFGDQRLQLADEVLVEPERKVGIDPGLECGHPQLTEPGDLGNDQLAPIHAGIRVAPPQAQRLSEHTGGGDRIVGQAGDASRYRDSNLSASISLAAAANTYPSP